MTGKKKRKHFKGGERSPKPHIPMISRLAEPDAQNAIENLLLKGKPREAIQALNEAPFKDKPPFRLLRILAYAMRERRLQEKGLGPEADAMLDIVSSELAKAEDFTCQDIARVIAATPCSYAMTLFVAHMKKHPSCPDVERSFADNLVMSGGWSVLHDAFDDTPFKRDALIFAEASEDLNEARWQEGLAKLDPLSRKSPFASWKLFAKAMASAYKGDQADLERALRQLPEDFPLRKTLEILKRDGHKGIPELHALVNAPDRDLAQSIVAATQAKDKNIQRLIEQLALRLFPSKPDAAVHFLSEIVACILLRKETDPKIVSRLLPQSFARPMLLRLDFLHGLAFGPQAYPFCQASEYLSLVDAEFPQLGSREEVEAALYMSLLSRAILGKISPGMLHPEDGACLREWLGDKDVKVEDLFVAIADKVTRLAPEVYDHYITMRALNPSQISSKGKDLSEQILLRMKKLFPEDPFSYVELARVYWSKNAYRKSQKILEEAFAQAPYDPIVREYLGLGFLRAAIRGRNRRAFDIALKDLESAKELNIKPLIPLIQAILATTVYLESGDESRALKIFDQIPERAQRLRSMAYFSHDLMEAYERRVSAFGKRTQTAALKELKGALKSLSENELNEVIAPLSPELASLLARFNPVHFFEPLWPKILEKLSDQQVLGVYPVLLGSDREGALSKWVKNDVSARLRGQKGNTIFRFFHALAEYQIHPEKGSHIFFSLLETLDDDELRKLRDFSTRIASNFSEPLAGALTYFNFERLDAPFGFDFGFDPFAFDDEEDEEDFWDDAPPWGDADALDDLIAGLKKAGGEKEFLKLIFEMLLSEIADADMDDEELRAMGRELQLRGKGMIMALRGIYTGKHAKSLSRAGRLLLFPDQY